MTYQSLYRRYRPRRFSEVRGQAHVTTALRNAVRSGTEGHAYLFSGPRGTGKTSTARILAKALNCEDLRDGEPCCECGSCVAMEAGSSFDLFELDAASNNGVDAVRDLIERSVVGSPGRTKVYILDEVHMLSAAASNALLKTLEEPPDHVRFVLATTDPQKVLPTIRSRTQHFEFNLLAAAELEAYVRWVVDDAGLAVDDASVLHVVRQGRGSARDTLSALDQVVAAGGVVERAEPVEVLLQALVDHDPGVAVAGVADALSQGRDPRVLGDALLAVLRDAFLVSLGVEVAHLPVDDREQVAAWAERIGTPGLTRAVESIGSALVEMRQAADPRVPLEVALVRLSTAGSTDTQALLERLERLERAVAEGSRAGGPAASVPRPPTDEGAAPAEAAHASPPPRPRPAPRPARPQGPSASRSSAPDETPSAPVGSEVAPAAPAESGPPVPADGPRETLGAVRARTKQGSRAAAPARPKAPPAGPDAAPVPDATTTAAADPGSPIPAAAPGGIDRDTLVLAFGDVIAPGLKGMAKAIFSNGRFVSVTDQGAVFALENAATVERAEKYRSAVESSLAAHFGVPIALIVVEESDAAQHDNPATPAPAVPPTSVPAAPVPAKAASERAVDGGAVGGGAVVDRGAVDDDRDAEEAIDVSELEDADVAASGLDRLTQAFPGAVLMEGDEVTR